MKKKIFLLLSILFISQFYAQMVSNVRVSRDPDCGYYKILYDINGETNGGCFKIELTASNGKQELKNPKGMSGIGISELCPGGKDNIIFWYPNLFGYEKENWDFSLNLKITNFILVKGGRFIMGSNEKKDEFPHNVTVSSFFISKYEVTQKEWIKIMKNNPSAFKGDDLPVENISWLDAIDYCNKISLKEGLKPCYSDKNGDIICDWTANGYRLPTEAEWEYAAKGGIQSKGYIFSGSNDVNTVAWFENNATQTQKIGTKKPNELGLYDMSGNVFEWCWDGYDENYYFSKQNFNPKGYENKWVKVARGGCWNYNSDYCKNARRAKCDRNGKWNNTGLRVVRNYFNYPR